MLGYIPYLISISNYRTNPTFHPIDQTDNIHTSIHFADRNASLDRRPGALSSVPSPTVSCAHMLGKIRFLNTKIQETKETPWIRVFHFWGTGSYLSCREREPRSNGSGLLRASQPGTAASVRPSRPENDTLYRFLLRTGLENAARLAGSRSGKRSIRPQKKENTLWCSLSFGIRQLPIFICTASNSYTYKIQ